MPILPMITLLLEFLIVSCVLCVPQVDSSLYQIKHCLLLVKYSTRLETKSIFVSHPLFSCYISRIALAAVLYLVHIYVCLANTTKQRSEIKSNYTREVINTCSYTSGQFMSTGIAAGVDDLLYQPSNLGHK